MKNIREYLSSAAGLIKAQGRVLSMVMTLLILSNCAWATTYYIDCRDVNTGLNVSWIQKVEGSNDVQYTKDSPESGIISFDFTFSTSNEGKLKFSVAWSDDGLCHVEGISSTDMGSNNCIKVLKSGSNTTSGTVAKEAGLIEFTDYNKSVCDVTLPTVTTGDIRVTGDAATVVGNKTADYASKAITAQGVRFGTSSTSGANTAYTAGAMAASFDASISSLTLEGGTTYYYEAYSTNCAGTSYGEMKSYTHPAVSEETSPTVRIGAKPSITESCGLDVNAYVAQTGCENITDITLYYSNNRAFRTDGSYLTSSKNLSVTDAPAINTSKTITLTAAEIGAVVEPGNTVYLRLTATNDNGTSGYSDILPFAYSCTKFVTSDIVANFTACPNNHQFNWSDMFLSPTPTTWRATLGGSDATSHFTLTDGVMVWNTEGKTESQYVYKFTASADGYGNATATLTINYTVPGSISGEITSVTPDPVTSKENPTTPYTEVGLTAEGTIGDISQIEWTIKPSGGSISNESGNTLPATATFKAEAKTYNTTYTVTATGYNSSCASSSASTKIVVAPDETEVCD